MRDHRSLEQKIKAVVREAAENRNTEIRKKIENVGRAKDNVTNDSSKLAKQAEIQRKIIDEDSEYGMARNELETAKRAIDRLKTKMGKGEGELEAWVQSKITKASDYLDTVADYIESGSVKEEAIDEADMPSAHKMAKSMVKGFRGHKAVLHPDGSATVHTKGGVDANHRPTYSSANVVDSHLKNNGFDYNHPTKEYDNHTQSRNGHTVQVTRTSSGHSIHIRSNNVREETIEEDAVASVSTKDSAKEHPETGKKKKDNDKDLMEPGTIKGGKTEVDLEPTTDDRDDSGKKLDDKANKATKAANAQAGVKEETMNTSKNFGLPADLIATVAEALKGNQKKIDKNHNGKIDKQDFKILRKEEVVDEERMSKGRRDALARKTSFTADPPRRLEKPEPKETKSDKMKAYRADRDKHGEMEEEAIDEVLDTPMKKLGYIAKNAYQVATADPAKMANDPKKANAIANRVIGAKRFQKKLNKEEVEELDEVNNRDYAAKGKMHPDMAKGMHVGKEGDFYAHGTGDKKYGKVVKNTGKEVHIKQTHDSYSDKKINKLHKFKVSHNIDEETDPGFSEAELAHIEAITKDME